MAAARVLFAGGRKAWPRFRPHLETGFRRAGIDAELLDSTDEPESIDYLIYAPDGADTDLTRFTRLKLVQSLWAGVETIVRDSRLRPPLARMVDPGMIRDMVSYVTCHVLRHHLAVDAFQRASPGVWLSELLPPPVHERTVGILGAGVLGSACATALAGLGFDVTCWGRSRKAIEGVAFEREADGLERVLSRSSILVLMLPRTPETENLLGPAEFATLSEGAAVINPSRGHLIDDEALLDALDSGHLSGATLDVFRKEPLPASHRYWTHPRVLITPHVAATTHPETAATVVVENIRRGETGEDFLHLVDREKGY